MNMVDWNTAAAAAALYRFPELLLAACPLGGCPLSALGWTKGPPPLLVLLSLGGLRLCWCCSVLGVCTTVAM